MMRFWIVMVCTSICAMVFFLVSNEKEGCYYEICLKNAGQRNIEIISFHVPAKSEEVTTPGISSMISFPITLQKGAFVAWRQFDPVRLNFPMIISWKDAAGRGITRHIKDVYDWQGQPLSFSKQFLSSNYGDLYFVFKEEKIRVYWISRKQVKSLSTQIFNRLTEITERGY